MNMVEGHGENLTQQQVFNLRTEALYLRCAYGVARKSLGLDIFN